MRLRKSEFERYLQRNRDEIFDCRETESCPIACYLTRRDDHDVAVADDWIHFDGYAHRTPLWAKEFIIRWDSLTVKNARGFVALQVLG